MKESTANGIGLGIALGAIVVTAPISVPWILYKRYKNAKKTEELLSQSTQNMKDQIGLQEDLIRSRKLAEPLRKGESVTQKVWNPITCQYFDVIITQK